MPLFNGGTHERAFFLVSPIPNIAFSRFFSRKNRDTNPRARERVRSTQNAEALARQEILAVKKPRRFPTLQQWKHLPRFLSTGEKRLALGALIVALLALVALGFRFLSTYEMLVPAAGGRYTEGLVGTPALVNPLYASASDVDQDLARLVFSGLMRFDPEEGLVPDLASSFTASPDGTSFTFILRDDVRFHNGDLFTSEDVAFTIRAIQNPEYRSPLAQAFSGVTVDTPDERTVTFTLPEASQAFLANATVGILPSGVWSEVPPQNAPLTQLNLKPIGTGPYAFEKLTKDSRGSLRSMTFTRNKRFYRGAPYIETLQFKFAATVDELPNLLRNKNIEGAVTIPFTEAPKFTDDRSLQIIYPYIPQYTAAFFNLKSTGPAGDANVRKALDIGTDRAPLVTTALRGNALPLVSPLVIGMPGALTADAVPGADIPGAQTALDAAGFKVPEGGGVRMKGDVPLSLTLTYANTAELEGVAQELKRQWEALGVTVNVKGMSADELQDAVRDRSFDILLAGELYGTFRDPYPYWHSSQAEAPGLNIPQLVSRTADDYMMTIRSTTDETKRGEAYAGLMKILEDQHVAVFLYEPQYTYVTSAEIKGITLPLINLPADRFANVNEWYIRTKAVLRKPETR